MNISTQETLQLPSHYTAFHGFTRIASGTLTEVLLKAQAAVDRDRNAALLVFNDETAETVELDLRGTPEPAFHNFPLREQRNPQVPAGPGRPRLGVVAREVTLLPRHWEWLNQQPGGASVALRRLVEDAKRINAAKDRIRQAQEACYRFLSTIAGDLPGFEEAARALFGRNRLRFEEMIADWPADVRDYAQKMGEAAFDGTSPKATK